MVAGFWDHFCTSTAFSWGNEASPGLSTSIQFDSKFESMVIRPTPWRGCDFRCAPLVRLSRFRDWLYRCRRTWTRAGYARRRMRAACARVRAREQCRVSPRPCRTTYHHPGPEPTPVLSSLSLFFSLFLSLSSLLPTDRPTDRPTNQPTNRPTDLIQSTHPPTL